MASLYIDAPLRVRGLNYEPESYIYIGESSRNLYTRSQEHLKNFRSGNQSSFILKHQNTDHEGAGPDYKAKVVASANLKW